VYFDPRGASLAKRSIMPPPARSPLDHDARAILVVRRHQCIIEARKFVAKALTGNDPTVQFRTFTLQQPKVAIFLDKHPPITRCHRRSSSRRFTRSQSAAAPRRDRCQAFPVLEARTNTPSSCP
jgi:hypothetical protein